MLAAERLLWKDLAKPGRNSALGKPDLIASKGGRKQLRETTSDREELLPVAKCETSRLEPQGHEGLDSLLFSREKMMWAGRAHRVRVPQDSWLSSGLCVTCFGFVFFSCNKSLS